MNGYEELFNQRAGSYHGAMAFFPNARSAEFQSLASRIPVDGALSVLDIPAGGGYLKAYLPTNCTYQGHEPCAGFDFPSGTHGVAGALVPIPFESQTFDVACSLAGLHHVENKVELFLELHRVCKPGGIVILSDVAEYSPVANFLDDFVGLHNSTGHEGLYLNKQTEDDLTAAGWQVLESKPTKLFWQFNNTTDMVNFVIQLFDMSGIEHNLVLNAINEILGGWVERNGKVQLPWELHTITAKRADSWP